MSTYRPFTDAGRARRAALSDAAFQRGLGLGSFSYGQLAADLSISVDLATEIVRGWVRAGLAEEAGRGTGNRKLFAMTRKAEIAPPEGPRDKIWRSMRALGSFTEHSLRMHSSTEACPVSESDIAEFIDVVETAGIVRRGGSHWRLVRDPGPRAPVMITVPAVWDPNAREFEWLGGPDR